MPIPLKAFSNSTLTHVRKRAQTRLPDNLTSGSTSSKVSRDVNEMADESTANRKRAPAQRAALATLLCLFGFFGFWAGAMALYPGGTWLDRAKLGQSFFANFFCDLAQPVSLSGVANPVGSRLAQAGMLFFAGALAGLFWLVPRHFASESRVGSWVRRLGTLSVAMFIAVPLTPSEVFGTLHATLALTSGAFGLLAAGLSVWALFHSDWRARALGVLGLLTLLVGAFDAVIFVHHLGEPTPPPVLVPAAQKVAALLLSAWIAAVAILALFGDDHSA
jgi:hypothetical protein